MLKPAPSEATEQMTEYQRKQVIEAIDEMHRTLDRAMRCSPEFRDMKLISFYNDHVATLTGYLESGQIAVWVEER